MHAVRQALQGRDQMNAGPVNPNAPNSVASLSANRSLFKPSHIRTFHLVLCLFSFIHCSSEPVCRSEPEAQVKMATTRPSAAIQIVKPPSSSGPIKVSAPTSTLGPTKDGSAAGAGTGGGGGLNVNAAAFGVAPSSPDRRKGGCRRLLWRTNRVPG